MEGLRSEHSKLLSKWLTFHVTGPFLTNTPPHRILCIGTEMPEKEAVRGGPPTCVEGGGCCASVSSQPPVDPCAGGEAGASVWSPPPPHHTTSWWEDARPRGHQHSRQQQPTVKHTPAQRAQVSGGGGRGIVDTHCSDSLLMSLLLFFFCGFLGNLENIKSSRA